MNIENKIIYILLASAICTAASNQDIGQKNVDISSMVLIPEGEFVMGINSEILESKVERAYEACYGNTSDFLSHKVLWEDALIPHPVFLDSYYIDKYEVTQKEYYECVQARACGTPPDFLKYPNDKDKMELPVMVSWFDANYYCTWKGKRLPTESEWEKAARGNDGRIFPWGNEIEDGEANIICDPSQDDENTVIKLQPPGSYPKDVSPYGVYDMAGNIGEWCSDKYRSNYYRKSPYENPKGPRFAFPPGVRVIRGGYSYWNSSVYWGNSIKRSGLSTGYVYDSPHAGIRCVVSQREIED